MGDAFAESLVAMDGIPFDEADDDYLEEEVEHGDVEEAEDNEEEGAEIEDEHEIEQHHLAALTMDFLADVGRGVVGVAELLLEACHEVLELRSAAFLLLGVGDVGLLDESLNPRGFGTHLVVDFLLLDGVVEFGTFFAFEEEEVHLDVVVGRALLAGETDDARDGGKDEGYAGGDERGRFAVSDSQPAELEVVVGIEAINEGGIDGDIPSVACGAVEDTAKFAFLARHACQLTIGAVQEDAYDVHPQSSTLLIIIAAMGEKDTARGTDNHGDDGDGIGVHAYFSK